LRHTGREAVAYCPECRHSFCRECITEHEDRVLCADCLARARHSTVRGRSTLARLVGITFGFVGLATAWLFFYCLGEALTRAPVRFHDGTIGKNLRRKNE